MNNNKDIIDMKSWSPSGDSPVRAEDGVTEIDHLGEKKLIRKLDLHIIPFVMSLYLFSFLDRYVSL